MKKILLWLLLAGLITACGNKRGGTGSDTDSTSIESSTTPPPTEDTTGPIGTMMGDTTISEFDSLDGGQDK